MLKKQFAFLACILAFNAPAAAPPAQPFDRSSLIETRRSIYFGRLAEKRGDVASAAERYLTAVSYLESSAPRDADLSKLVICDEPVPSIGRRMIYYWIKLLHQELAKSNPTISVEHCLKTLRSCYAKMAWIEKGNPTWPYLEAVASAADGDYRAAFTKCREAATAAGGEESVRRKARSLAAHIKPGALEQEKMKEEDWAAYNEYVSSGAQALDFATVSARYSADDARRRGDHANADMWESRHRDLLRQREQIRTR
ncbi:MAG: hypothetical protein QOH39_2440 [Verrucomicrobiota bacterium]|jgi:hypothetical protein